MRFVWGIIEPELSIDPENREYFDSWGRRAYLYSDEISYNPAVIMSQEEADLNIDSSVFREMDGKYTKKCMAVYCIHLGVAKNMYGGDIKQERSIMSTSDSFNKDCTLITKGILIIMMLVHHLFTQDLVQTYAVQTAFSNAIMHQHISECCKMCISGYAFLSAFGMTCSLKKMNDNTEKAYFKFVARRIIKLEASLIFIYIVAILFKRFVMLESIRKVYENGNGFSFICLIIDMLGMAEYFGTPTVNITWWYMSYALLLVVMMPFIYILYKRYGLTLFIAVIGGGCNYFTKQTKFCGIATQCINGNCICK